MAKTMTTLATDVVAAGVGLIDELVTSTAAATASRSPTDAFVAAASQEDEFSLSLIESTTTLIQTIENTTKKFEYTDDMLYTSTNTICIVFYSFLFIFSSIGNIKVLIVLIKKRLRSPSRIDAMLMHLAIADLIVTFILMPADIIHAATVQWYAGDVMCKIVSFFRTFGIYLSSYVIICISLDRYYAILKPLKISGIDSRTRIMLATAWVAAAICSAPQAYIFNLSRHPQAPEYKNCKSLGHSHSISIYYQIISWLLFYALPLAVIVFCYFSIYTKIYRRTKKALSGNVTLRRTNMDVLGRAKRRTLKMTATIVIVFIICWSPFNIMYMWFTFDHESARTVHPLIMKISFIFACANSCMNPIVYGIFNANRKKKHEHIIVTQISSLSKRSTCKSI